MYTLKNALNHLAQFSDDETRKAMLDALNQSAAWRDASPDQEFCALAAHVYREGGEPFKTMHAFVSLVRPIAHHDGELMEDILFDAGLVSRRPHFLVAREVLISAERASREEKDAIHAAAMEHLKAHPFPENLDAPTPYTLADLLIEEKWEEARAMLAQLTPIAPQLAQRIEALMKRPEARIEWLDRLMN